MMPGGSTWSAHAGGLGHSGGLGWPTLVWSVKRFLWSGLTSIHVYSQMYSTINADDCKPLMRTLAIHKIQFVIIIVF